MVQAVLLGADSTPVPAPFVHIEDFESERLGAPGNPGLLLEAVSKATVPVQYWGGINLVHVAEMVLGLGVSRVVIGDALWRTPQSAAHFVRVLGDRCVCRIPLSAVGLRAGVLKEIGAARVLIDVDEWGRLHEELELISASSMGVQLCCDHQAWQRERNLIGQLPVELEAVVIRPEQNRQETT